MEELTCGTNLASPYAAKGGNEGKKQIKVIQSL